MILPVTIHGQGTLKYLESGDRVVGAWTEGIVGRCVTRGESPQYVGLDVGRISIGGIAVVGDRTGSGRSGLDGVRLWQDRKNENRVFARQRILAERSPIDSGPVTGGKYRDGAGRIVD